MNNLNNLYGIVLSFTILIFLSGAKEREENINKKSSYNPPNIIIINMDDMGYGDTEPFGMTGIPTPNFNKLAKEGMRFTHFCAAQPICSASRAALLTGCYPNRIGIHGALAPQAKFALNPKEETIASILKKAGYATAMYGKWHLGARAPYLPVHYGFDDYYGLPYSNDMWPYDYDGKLVTDPTNRKSKHPFIPVYQGDKQVDTINSMEKQSQLTTIMTEKATSFIKSNKNKLFFIYLAHPMPHVPLAVSEKFKGKSELGLFGDVIRELDWSLGQILSTLKVLKLTENTVVIVTSDNGPWLTFGNHAGSSGGFKEGKGTTSDGGVRVPCLIRWPGKVEAGSICSQLMTNMDLLPTIAAIANAPLPVNKIDGFNFLPFLTGQSSETPRDVFYYYYDVNSLQAVRYKHWKLVLPHKGRSYVQSVLGKDGIAGDIKETVNVSSALYDLSHDPGESYDLQKQYPEMLNKLLMLAEEARNDLGDDLTNRKGNIRMPAVW